MYLKYIEADDKLFEFRNDDEKRKLFLEELKRSEEVLESALDRFILYNKDRLHELGEDFQLSNEELQKRERMYTEIIQIQEKELEELERLIHMLEDRKKEEIIKGIKEKIDEKNRLESMLEIGDLSKKQY